MKICKSCGISFIGRVCPNCGAVNKSRLALALFILPIFFLFSLICFSGVVRAGECTSTLDLPCNMTTNGVTLQLQSGLIKNCTGEGLPSNFGCINLGYSGGKTANNVILDCNYSTIYGIGTSTVSGIHVMNSYNITIKNCNINGFGTGIYAIYNNGAENNLNIQNTDVFNSSQQNIYINSYNNTVLYNVTSHGSNASHGVYFDTSQRGDTIGYVVNFSRFYNNSNIGVQFNSGNKYRIPAPKVYNTLIYGNGGEGINDLASDGGNYYNNTIYGNQKQAIVFGYNPVGIGWNYSAINSNFFNNTLYDNCLSCSVPYDVSFRNYTLNNSVYGNTYTSGAINLVRFVNPESFNAVENSSINLTLDIYMNNSFVRLNYNGLKNISMVNDTITLTSPADNKNLSIDFGNGTYMNNVQTISFPLASNQQVQIHPANSWTGEGGACDYLFDNYTITTPGAYNLCYAVYSGLNDSNADGILKVNSHNVQVYGHGLNSSGNMTGNFLRVVDYQNVTLQNFTVSNYSISILLQTFLPSSRPNAVNISLLDTIVYNSKTDNIYAAGINTLLLDNVNSYNAGSHGIYLDALYASPNATNNIIRNSKFHHNKNIGIHMNSGNIGSITNSQIYNNEIYNNTNQGINDLAGNGTLIYNNNIHDNSGQAIVFSYNPTLGYSWTAFNESFYNNTLTNNGADFISQQGALISYSFVNTSFNNRIFGNIYDNDIYLVTYNSPLNYSFNETSTNSVVIMSGAMAGTPTTGWLTSYVKWKFSLNYSGVKNIVQVNDTITDYINYFDISPLAGSNTNFRKADALKIFSNSGTGNASIFLRNLSSNPQGYQYWSAFYSNQTNPIGSESTQGGTLNVSVAANGRVFVFSYLTSTQPKYSTVATTISQLTAINDSGYKQISFDCTGSGGITVTNLATLGSYIYVYKDGVLKETKTSINDYTTDGCSSWIFSGTALAYFNSETRPSLVQAYLGFAQMMSLVVIMALIGGIVFVIWKFQQGGFNISWDSMTFWLFGGALLLMLATITILIIVYVISTTANIIS